MTQLHIIGIDPGAQHCHMAVLRTEVRLFRRRDSETLRDIHDSWKALREFEQGGNDVASTIDLVEFRKRICLRELVHPALIDHGWLDCDGRFLIPSDPELWKWDQIALVVIEGFTSYAPNKKGSAKFASRLQTHQVQLIQNIGRIRAECYMRDVACIVLSPQKIKSACGIPIGQGGERKNIDKLRRHVCERVIANPAELQRCDRDEIAALNAAIAGGRIYNYVS